MGWMRLHLGVLGIEELWARYGKVMGGGGVIDAVVNAVVGIKAHSLKGPWWGGFGTQI